MITFDKHLCIYLEGASYTLTIFRKNNNDGPFPIALSHAMYLIGTI